MTAPLPAGPRQAPGDDTVLACVRCIPAQRTAAPDTVATARAWLWAHTAQPNGDPWDACPDLLDQAATALAATIRTEA